MEMQVLWVVSGICAATLAGVFWKMKGGFGPNNLKAVGIVLVAFLASVLSVSRADGFNAAIGLLGAVAGYLFGVKSKQSDDKAAGSGVSTTGSSFGDFTKIAGRDLNETVNNLQGQIAGLERLLSGATNVIQTTSEAMERSQEYLIDQIFARGNDMRPAVERSMEKWEALGWHLQSFSSDYQGTDGLFVIYRRPKGLGGQTLTWYLRTNEEYRL